MNAKRLGWVGIVLALTAPVQAREKIGEVLQGFVLDATHYDHAHQLADGRSMREYVFTEPGASFVKLRFGALSLGAKERLTLLDGSARPVEIYTGRGPADGNAFWALSVPGDTAILRLETTGKGYFSIDGFARGTPEFGRTADTESVCPGTNNDFTGVACATNLSGPAGSMTDDVESAVGHIRFVEGSSVYMCTGSAVSGNNHFLTNEHCFPAHTQAQCDSYEVYFDYETASCSATSGTKGSALRCTKLLKYNATLDYALLTLNAYPGKHLTLTDRALTVGEYLFIVQHPSGYPKKVAEDKVLRAKATGNAAETDLSYQAETLGGSSGSPVFDSKGEVIGLHHFGGCSSTAGNQGVRMELILPEIEGLLGSPTGTVAVR